jgi:O-methyltransferase
MLRQVLDSSLVLRVLEVLGRRMENRVSEFGMLGQAFEFARTNGMPGDYFEFGLWRGKTFGWARTMARRYGFKDITFRGFDSFQGLPEPTELQYNIWRRGQFSFGRLDFEKMLKKKGFRKSEYELTEGFYDQTLTPELSSQLQARGVKAAVVYIDCDLYESTAQVLRFVRPFLQDGTIVCFDDYFTYRGRPDMGEQRALAEFQEANPTLQMRPYVLFGSAGMSFIHYATTVQNVTTERKVT